MTIFLLVAILSLFFWMVHMKASVQALVDGLVTTRTDLGDLANELARIEALIATLGGSDDPDVVAAVATLAQANTDFAALLVRAKAIK